MYTIDFDGPQGNAFSILALAQKIIEEQKLDLDFSKISKEMKAGDYDNLVAVFISYFDKYLNLV
jgi:hypothetical protein